MVTQRTPITVIGAGSWGTALAILLARNGNPTRLWGNDLQELQAMQTAGENQFYLPGARFPNHLDIVFDIQAAVGKVEDILLAVPSHAFQSVLEMLQPFLTPTCRIVWATKGLNPHGGRLLNDTYMSIMGQTRPFAILSGPSFAKEVAADLPTAVTIASSDEEYAQQLLPRFHSNNFRVYLSTDVIGTALCGAVKNVLAIATGISDGLGFGANARAALITRGLAEMSRLGAACGAEHTTFMGLVGLGDLVLTCTDDQSRNRRFGLAVGAGSSFDEAKHRIGQVVEGIENAEQVHILAKRQQIKMPICQQVYAVLKKECSPLEAANYLLSRQATAEFK